MRHWLKLIATFSITLAIITPLSATDFDSAKLGKIRERMQGFVDQKIIAGAVTVIGSKDGVASLEAVGLQKIETKQPMPKDALFRIASMTKPITAMGIMILQEEGKLSVDDLVEKHLPEFRGQRLTASREGDTVTLKKPSRAITHSQTGFVPNKFSCSMVSVPLTMWSSFSYTASAPMRLKIVGTSAAVAGEIVKVMSSRLLKNGQTLIGARVSGYE